MPCAGEHLAEGLPQAHRAVADHQLRVAHAAAAALTQQVSPRLGGLPQPLGQRDQFLRAVQAHAEQDQDARVGLAKPDLRMDPVRPHVDIVAVRQVPLLEGGVVVLPLPGQPGHSPRRQPGRAAEELLQRQDEVPRRGSVNLSV
jgi:hypothetical protein